MRGVDGYLDRSDFRNLGWSCLTFTEVSFELGDDRHPLCRATRLHPGAHAVYRILEPGDDSRHHWAHITFQGPAEASADIIREMRAAIPEATVEVLHQGADMLSFLLEIPSSARGLENVVLTPSQSSRSWSSDLGANGGTVQGQGGHVGLHSPTDADNAWPSGHAGLAAISPALQARGIFAVIDPILAVDGKLRVRLVVPRHAETHEMLRALQDVQRAAGFPEFRLTRIAPLTPAAHVEQARRQLTPDQESLLSLASSMGYYETPKAVTLEQIARAVGLSISPVHKRLKSAEETIVSAHVNHCPDGPRRRSRTVARLDASSPWEVQIRARGDFGPVSILAHVPGARASIHPLVTDNARAPASLVVAVASADVQAKFLSAIEMRPEVISVATIGRSDAHIAARVTTRERGPWALSWWNDAWGYDAALRSVVFENGEARVRALLTRPFTSVRFEEKMRDCARGAGWTDWEVESMRSLCGGGPPPSWPDPLTTRQIEVLRAAHAQGYYQTPRDCTLEHVAKTLGVSANAVHKNLVLAESKLIASYLAAGI